MQNKTFESVRLCSPKLVDFRQSESHKIERSCDAVSHNVAHTGNSCPILLPFSAGMFGRACPRSDRRYFWDHQAYTASTLSTQSLRKFLNSRPSAIASTRMMPQHA